MQTVTLTDDATLDPAAWPTTEIVTLVVAQDGAGGHALTLPASVITASGVVWSVWSAPASETVATFRHSAALSKWVCEGCWTSILGTYADTTPPTISSMTVTGTGPTRNLTIMGAVDPEGLHGIPYRFSLDGGTTWSDWQASGTFETANLAVGTYKPRGQVRNAAGLTATVTASDFTIAAAGDTSPPTWSATFTMGTPTSKTVTATASAMATDNVAVSRYEVSYNGGTNWSTITPTGSVFALAGAASTTYSTTKLRAKDAAGNVSTALSVPSYTMAAPPPSLATIIAGLGPVGYWKLDETSGTIANDSSGNGRHGTYNSVTLNQTDGFARMGPYGWVEMADADVWSLNNSGNGLSAFMLVRPPGTAGRLMRKFETGASEYSFELHTGGLRSIVNGTPQSLDTQTGGAFTTNAWNAIAFASPHPAQGMTVKHYVNSGTPKTTTRDSNTTGTTYTNGTAPLTISSNGNGAANTVMGHVCVFPYQLSDAQVQSLMYAAAGEGFI